MSQSYTISLNTTCQYILSDIARYRAMDKSSYLAIFVTYPGIIATIYYRIGHWTWYPAEINKAFLYILRPFYMIIKRLVTVYCGASLSPKARIGRGLYIGTFGSILVDASIIGENCTLSHEVTIGMAGMGKDPTVLGDRVFVGAGAKVIGPIKVGNDVAIGANTVVMNDIADCAVAAGIPAKVVSYKGSFDFVLYADMENDPRRQQSIYEHNLWQRALNPRESMMVTS